MHGFKRALRAVFGRTEEAKLTREYLQQVGWILGIMLWIPAQLIWITIMLKG